MKKTVSLALVLVMLFTMVCSTVGCQHVHEFVLSESESTPATCVAAGVEVKVCSCGERQETQIEPTGHDMQVTMEIKPSCTRPGSTDYKCVNCGKMEYTNIEPTGHAYEEAPSEPSRVIRCTNEGCVSCQWGEANNKHKEALTFNFTKEDEAAIDAKYEEVLAMVNAAAKYDPALHGYAEEGALADEYARVDAAHTELYELVMNALSQRQLAEIAYYCNMKDAALEETYTYMMDYHTAVVAKFYTLSRPFYDSCYREFYYYGMTDEEINAFLFDSDAISNPEYTALKDRNNAIEAEFVALSSSDQKKNISVLYAEFAENNNKMANLMGYDNYLEYAYENVYGRDYTYQDVTAFSKYVKEHLSAVFTKTYKLFRNLTGYSDAERETYYGQVKYPFFENLEGNTLVNDYIDLMAFTSNPDKMITFSDEFNKLMVDGNMFRGQYDGAFVTTIHSAKLPIAYFGRGYDNCFTVVHEFGHFMNEVYSADVAEENDEFSQSYDLLEMHSQGNELLYLCYLEENAGMTEMAHRLVETHSLVNMLYVVMAGMTIDSFEQAIYLNAYEGTNADQIMADGKITHDEYDLLYTSICADYGVEEEIGDYWLHGMTITSPCYYVSYSVSAISVLQLYEMAHTDGFDVAKDAYLKLFTYVDENPEMTMNEVLAYAGMLSYSDEELYVNLKNYMNKK
ncbi:MAG: hypothetical protein E7605_08435 [Ruminococcaceae bacterium]|nr:hypothetical protein [Oscillospiraceae bacterium]